MPVVTGDALKAGRHRLRQVSGRGGLQLEDDILAALDDGTLLAATLDVFATEPLPADSPFWDLPNVFITPHIGGYVIEYEDFIMPLIVDNMRLFLAGRPGEMRNIVVR